MSRVSEGAMESIRDIPGFARDASGSGSGLIDETQVPSREEMSGARRTAADARVLTRAELESEMSSVGLLGLISSRAGTAMMDYEYIDDLLGYADLNAEQLETVLSKLSSIQVPRHNTAGYILSYKKGADVAGGNIKGGRKLAESDIENAIKDIEPLETARTTASKRIVEYEEIPSSPLAQLQAIKEVPKMRNPEDVVRIVQSHKPALQDCYKQELKTNPDVKGKIIVRFTVNPEGSVVDASIVSSTLNSPAMDECIVRRIQNWRNFPICDASLGNVTYKQVFNFGS